MPRQVGFGAAAKLVAVGTVFVGIIVVLAPAASAQPTDYYVASGGTYSGSGVCTAFTPLSDACGTIQQAINLAEAQTNNAVIMVDTGTYSQQLLITPSTGTISIAGTGGPVTIEPTTIIAADNCGSSSQGGTEYGIVNVGKNVSGFSISGVTVNGAGDAPNVSGINGFVGICDWDSQVTVDAGVTVSNIGMAAVGHDNYSIYAFSDGSLTLPATTLTAASTTTVTNFGKSGFNCSGTNTQCTIEHAVVTNTAPRVAGQTAPNGIEIGTGAAATVESNTVTGASYTGDYPTHCWVVDDCGTGILIFDDSAAVIVSDNVNLSLNDIDIQVDGSGGSTMPVIGPGNMVSNSGYASYVDGSAHNAGGGFGIQLFGSGVSGTWVVGNKAKHDTVGVVLDGATGAAVADNTMKNNPYGVVVCGAAAPAPCTASGIANASTANHLVSNKWTPNSTCDIVDYTSVNTPANFYAVNTPTPIAAGCGGTYGI